MSLALNNRTTPRARVLSGMRPTGRLHLGNYMGALHNWVKLQQEYDCYFFIADLHALTTDYADPSRLKQSVFDVAVDFLSAGINPGKCTLFVQSHVPQHAELHLLFSMFTPLGWLERVPTYKDQQAQLAEKDLNTYGFLGYPLLQSADILLYKPAYVPVGADQVAHVELTREVARKFNHMYAPKSPLSEVTVERVPEPLLPEPDVLLTPSPKLPGLDGRKMSKSYGNAIYLSDPAALILQKLHGMTNGGQRRTQYDPGDPDICPVGDLHKVFSDPFTLERTRLGCRYATIGCNECKFLAGTSIVTITNPIQNRRAELEEKPDVIWEVLERGGQRAQSVAEETMKSVRTVTGLSRDLTGVRPVLSRYAPAADVRDLQTLQNWRGLPPRVLEANLRDLWHRELVPLELQLKPESDGVWLTHNKRRVYVAAAEQDGDSAGWTFSAKPKSYEVLVLLCLSTDLRLRDFVVPQKLYLQPWVEAKRRAGKQNITFSVVQNAGKVLLLFPEKETAIDITETERAYGIL